MIKKEEGFDEQKERHFADGFGCNYLLKSTAIVFCLLKKLLLLYNSNIQILQLLNSRRTIR
jgi:hypothetical protein